MHEEPDWVSVDGNFEDEVWGRARLHRLPGHSIMEGVDQCLVKVENKDLPLDNAEPVADGQRQVWSLTQFYSVDFSQSRISVKKCVFNKCMRPVEEHCVTTKSPSRVLDRDETFPGRKKREKLYFLEEGPLMCPAGRSMIFFTKKETEKH